MDPKVVASASDTREVLQALVDAARAYGEDISDHDCSPSPHEDAFWRAERAAQRFLFATKVGPA